MPPEAAQDPAVLAVRVQALESALQRLVEAQAQNHAHLHKAFFMTDAHLWVLKMICIDIVENKVVKTDEGSVALQRYYEAFNEMQRRAAEAAKNPVVTKKPEKLDEDTEVIPPAEVFGGDVQHVSGP